MARVGRASSERARMVDEQLRARGIHDARTLAAFGSVPRELFVPPELAAEAYADRPLQIGHGQTISQPYIVARTVEALGLRGSENVLEVGTGSGYAAAILGCVARRVHTVECIEPFARLAASRLRILGLDHVRVHHADGSIGMPGYGPYDAIAVAAGAPVPPPSLLDQLAIGGRMVLPYGGPTEQWLVRITRQPDGTLHQEQIESVRFVPLVGIEGWGDHPPAAFFR